MFARRCCVIRYYFSHGIGKRPYRYVSNKAEQYYNPHFLVCSIVDKVNTNFINELDIIRMNLREENILEMLACDMEKS